MSTPAAVGAAIHECQSLLGAVRIAVTALEGSPASAEHPWADLITSAGEGTLRLGAALDGFAALAPLCRRRLPGGAVRRGRPCRRRLQARPPQRL